MNKVRDGIMGVAIGDMLGVPVEFMRREALAENPVTGPREHGSHDQPLGAWSDDTAQTLALADALTKDFSLQTIAENFMAWWLGKRWTSHGYVFDIGQRTLLAFNELRQILASGDFEALEYLHLGANPNTNGNGSLMRTLPLYFYLKDKGIEENFKTIWQVSALTHPHIRSALACLMYLIMIDELCKEGTTPVTAYKATQARLKVFMENNEETKGEEAHFVRLLADIPAIPRAEIKASGYVIDTLEASFWCFLTTTSYEEAVLKAVNLGQDTDTVGAVTGGLAGIYYGITSIPKDWIAILPHKEVINEICRKLELK
jgi:ADP-ribosyl-[dinitrogen reductase] hydrolase